MTRRTPYAVAACLAGMLTSAASALEVLGTDYQADVPYPQFMHLWSEGWGLKGPWDETVQYAREGMPLGAYVHVFVRNSGDSPVRIEDAEFQGVSLTEAIAFAKEPTAGRLPAGIRFSALGEAQRERLLRGGDPVWWKVDPARVPPGGTSELVVRLRRAPADARLEISVRTDAGAARATITPFEGGPRFGGISFSADLREITAFVRHQPGSRLAKVLLDGADVTGAASISGDATLDASVVLIRLPNALEQGSFHTFQVSYEDGKSAWAGIRAFNQEFVYGMWGYINKGATDEERRAYFLNDLLAHNVNAIMYSYPGHVDEFLHTEEGTEFFRKHGMRAMRTRPGKVKDPLYYFLMDEPDAHDYAVSALPPMERLGSLAQSLIKVSREFREQEPRTPHLLNIDNTYKPENWYMYARIADVMCADPYYQEQQRIVWNDRPAWAASFIKPTYVLGVTTICQSACAPRPLHIILNSVRHDMKEGPFRFATPAEKRIEAYYAVAAGAKAISYWWYTPYDAFYGVGGDGPEAKALWDEMGNIGAELRTAGELIMRSCPVDLQIRSPARLWVRSLAAGTDSLILLAVNESVASDRLGTVVRPLEKSHMELKVPQWLQPKQCFEIAAGGVRDVDWSIEQGSARIDLGRTELARMLVLTSDAGLRERLTRQFERHFAANASRLRPVDGR